MLALLSIVAYAYASFAPEGAVWGIHALAYYPVPIRIGVLAIAALLTVLYLRTPLFVRLADAIQTLASSRRNWLLVAQGTGLAAMILFLVFPIQTNAYGDSRHYQEWFGDNDSFDSGWILDIFRPNFFIYKEVLTIALHRTISHLLSVDILAVYRTVSAVSGGLFITLWLWFVGTTPSLRKWTAPLALTGLSLGSNQLFFGHVENYPFPFLCASLFFTAAFLMFEKKALFWLVLVLAAILIRAHATFVVVLPALVVVAAFRFRTRWSWGTRLLRWRTVTWIVIVPIVAAALALYVFYFRSYRWPPVYDTHALQVVFLPFVSQVPPLHNYSILSINHLADLANVAALTMETVILIVIGSLSGAVKKVDWSHPRILFCGVACFFAFAFFGVLNPVLSMPRDWDLMSLATVPALFLLAAIFAHLRDGSLRPEGPLLLAVLGALFVVPVFAVNASVPRLSERLEDVGEYTYRTYYEGSSYLIQAAHKMDPDPERRRRRRAATLSRLTPWELGEDKEYAYLLYTAAGICGELKDVDCAIDQLVRATRYDERYRKVVVQVGMAAGRPQLAMDQADSVLARDPDDLGTLVLGAQAAISVGDTTRCTSYLDHALQLAPGNTRVLEVLKAAREKGLYPR